MDRRHFLGAAGAAAGSLAIGGCLGSDDEEDITNIGEGPPQYDRPAYSGWPPAEGRDGEGVVFMHLRLGTLQAVQEAAAEGRLPTDQSVVALPLYGTEVVPAAIETITSYPFAAPLREAVNAAARTDAGSRTVVEPLGPSDTARTATETTNGTTTDTANETTDGSTNGTTADATNGTTGENETGSEDGDGFDLPIVGEDDDSTDETPMDRLGIEIGAVTLTAGLLVFHGRFDRRVIADRYTTGFERVDSQRGIRIYEAVGGSELAFAVGEDTLVVPTEAARTTPAETVLAHGLSSYIATLDRVVDTEDGGWLYETTGSVALGVGVWGTDTPLSVLASRAGGTTGPSTVSPSGPATDSPTSLPPGLPTGDEGGPVFGAASGLIDGLAVTTDDSGAITGFDARFAGVFPNAVPTEDELRTTLVGERSSEDPTVYIDESRAHLGAPVGSN